MVFPLVLRLGFLLVLLFGVPTLAGAQVISLHGEASASGLASRGSEAGRDLLGRYIPNLSGGVPLGSGLSLDYEASVNLWATARGRDGGHETDAGAEPYRAWVRLSSPSFELRTGLQKISFGSASVFRPLMWFDRVDPRDPLQLSEGVYAALGRAFLPGNVTLWGWGVLGEGERKGWEVIPTVDGSMEGGGRLQIPLGPGELAASYHRRDMDVGALLGPGSSLEEEGTEDRFALDGKWDLEIGLWVEATAFRQEASSLAEEWIRALNVGADYTFAVGNGLRVMAEHFWKEIPALKRDLVPVIPGGNTGAPPTGPRSSADLRITALTSSYPFGILDRIGLALYWDWENQELFRLMEWQRTYDRWRIHLLGFWNPEGSTLFPAEPGQGSTGSGSLAGTGVQLMVVMNH